MLILGMEGSIHPGSLPEMTLWIRRTNSVRRVSASRLISNESMNGSNIRVWWFAL
jgi:hypothetical protein